ncbi:Dcp2, box A domain-containing protein [Aspergillus pseudonomiae]|uniref:Dcp2, box A domain-containing protein n=1 Tax=Aspergillus pseudonomiae TaxID=1506151 RepID=A0A5N7DPT6_9EURO|nr:Dcp2, box A domain-containing protein [Aspergillus pseudonomiae]KAB8255525.1 Dcp2, box A domain-containing protein [Aspergillus pseudonomiae]KAE8408039.1 Dcp2, box A domain-containing protein [Aspergillus pseudonomiae]
MTETKMHLEDWLDDLCVRFIINLPREELESVERICFQVEEAQWFYEDFIRPLDPALPSLSLKAFALRIFQHCPLMSQWSHYHHITAFSEFLAYKTRVPVRGAIMLSQDMDEVVLVKGWKKGANWSFPRGKINKDEKDLDCAIREVYEETGFDVHEAGLVKNEKDVKFIEITMREQHMRLYVFRGVPRNAHFEPRTRKEISKIEWYNLSELPTLKKSKQQDQGLAVANANKFYMVAPFMHPLKKWIAQQKKLDTKMQAGVTQVLQNEGEMSMDEGFAAPSQSLGLTTSSDLPEVAPSQDASAHLKRLLNINDAVQQIPAPSIDTLPANASKSNALLELLRSGSSRGPTPQALSNEQTSPTHAITAAMTPQHPPYPAPTLFPGFPVQGPSAQPGYLGQFSPRQPPSALSHIPHTNNHVLDQHMPHRSLAQSSPAVNQHSRPAGYGGIDAYTSRHISTQPYNDAHVPSNQAPTAPYQQTGDPFSQPAQPPQVPGASVPPASKLPPPKLTSHSLALLSVFKDESSKTPKTSHASLTPQPEQVPMSGRKSSQHQDQLLSLLRGSPVTSGSTPAELAGHANSPTKKQILQRPRDSSPTQQALTYVSAVPKRNSLNSSAASRSVHPPQPEATAKPPGKKNQNILNRKNKDRQPQGLSSPITILARPQSAKREQSPNPAVASSSRTSSRTRKDSKPKTSEPPKPFQPQILRRSQNLDHILPVRTKEPHHSEQQDGPQISSTEREASNFDRRPSQSAAQKETLLSLFGKQPVSPGVSPAVDLNVHISGSKPVTSSVVSPLSPLNLPTPVGMSGESPAPEDNGSLNARVSSPDNKAFLLGFLQGVAKGNK